MSRENPEFGSQGNEDAVLAALLPQRRGRYVDIGAAHSSNCNNTWQFYCRGWRGILVEPLIDCWQDLITKRMGDMLMPVAISNSDYYADLRVQGSVSSLEPTWQIETMRIVKVPTMTIATLLKTARQEHKVVHLCSLDVEGHERQVLASIDWALFRPKVFCIEHIAYHPTERGEDLSPTWEPLVLERGYEFIAETEFNKIYALRDWLASSEFFGSVAMARSAAMAGMEVMDDHVQ